jgi:hypothetical protein
MALTTVKPPTPESNMPIIMDQNFNSIFLVSYKQNENSSSGGFQFKSNLECWSTGVLDER